MKRENIIFDTNIFVRALIGSAVNEKLYELFREGTVKIALSAEMLKELGDVLFRPRLGLNEEDIKYCLYSVKKKSRIIEPKIKVNICRDTKDNIVLETAIAAKANIIVTNDKDLLVLNPFQGINIFSPAAFITSLRE